MNAGEKAILSTLCYADVFDYPLTERELWRYHIGKPTTLEKFRLSINKLLHQKLIVQKIGYYVLKGRISLFTIRTQRASIAVGKMKVARIAARLLSYIPTVWLVGVSGALAMDNAPAVDDIDLFIVAAPRTLWTTRFLCTLLLDVLKLRRIPEEREVKDKICLNMFLDASRLPLPRKERDLYTAHEVVQLRSLKNKHHTYEQFLAANVWVKTYLPHAVKQSRLTFQLPRLWSARLLSRGERVFKWAQLRYMAKRRTREVVREKFLRFHPHDARKWVLTAYKDRVRQILAFCLDA